MLKRMTSTYCTAHVVNTVPSKSSDRIYSGDVVPHSLTFCVDGMHGSTDSSGFNVLTPIIIDPGDYNLIESTPSVVLSKPVVVSLSDCHVHIETDGVSTSTLYDHWFRYQIYLGTSSSVEKLLYYNSCSMSEGPFDIDIPDISRFDIASGKNIYLKINGGRSYGTVGVCHNFRIVVTFFS